VCFLVVGLVSAQQYLIAFSFDSLTNPQGQSCQGSYFAVYAQTYSSCTNTGVSYVGYVKTVCPASGGTALVSYCGASTNCSVCQAAQPDTTPCAAVPFTNNTYDLVSCSSEAPFVPNAYTTTVFSGLNCNKSSILNVITLPFSCQQTVAGYLKAICSGSATPSYEMCSDAECQTGCTATVGPVGCVNNSTAGSSVSFACAVAHNSTTGASVSTTSSATSAKSSTLTSGGTTTATGTTSSVSSSIGTSASSTTQVSDALPATIRSMFGLMIIASMLLLLVC